MEILKVKDWIKNKQFIVKARAPKTFENAIVKCKRIKDSKVFFLGEELLVRTISSKGELYEIVIYISFIYEDFIMVDLGGHVDGMMSETRRSLKVPINDVEDNLQKLAEIIEHNFFGTKEVAEIVHKILKEKGY